MRFAFPELPVSWDTSLYDRVKRRFLVFPYLSGNIDQRDMTAFIFCFYVASPLFCTQLFCTQPLHLVLGLLKISMWFNPEMVILGGVGDGL